MSKQEDDRSQIKDDLVMHFVNPFDEDDVKSVDFSKVIDRGGDIFDEPLEVLQELFQLRTFVSHMQLKYSQKYQQAKSAFEKFKGEKEVLYNKKNDDNPLYADDMRITNAAVKGKLQSFDKYHELRNEAKTYKGYHNFLEDLNYMLTHYTQFLKILIQEDELGPTTLKLSIEELKEENKLDDLKAKVNRLFEEDRDTDRHNKSDGSERN